MEHFIQNVKIPHLLALKTKPQSLTTAEERMKKKLKEIRKVTQANTVALIAEDQDMDNLESEDEESQSAVLGDARANSLHNKIGVTEHPDRFIVKVKAKPKRGQEMTEDLEVTRDPDTGELIRSEPIKQAKPPKEVLKVAKQFNLFLDKKGAKNKLAQAYADEGMCDCLRAKDHPHSIFGHHFSNRGEIA
jgi:hypothetical protein